MIKVYSMFPMTSKGPLEYSQLRVVGPPGLRKVKGLTVVDAEVFIADNYVFIRDEGRGRTTVFGLQTVQLDFFHIESSVEAVETP